MVKNLILYKIAEIRVCRHSSNCVVIKYHGWEYHTASQGDMEMLRKRIKDECT